MKVRDAAAALLMPFMAGCMYNNYGVGLDQPWLEQGAVKLPNGSRVEIGTNYKVRPLPPRGRVFLRESQSGDLARPYDKAAASRPPLNDLKPLGWVPGPIWITWEPPHIKLSGPQESVSFAPQDAAGLLVSSPSPGKTVAVWLGGGVGGAAAAAAIMVMAFTGIAAGIVNN